MLNAYYYAVDALDSDNVVYNDLYQLVDDIYYGEYVMFQFPTENNRIQFADKDLSKKAVPRIYIMFSGAQEPIEITETVGAAHFATIQYLIDLGRAEWPAYGDTVFLQPAAKKFRAETKRAVSKAINDRLVELGLEPTDNLDGELWKL